VMSLPKDLSRTVSSFGLRGLAGSVSGLAGNSPFPSLSGADG
jgi:hypothetical protein